jgi:hypothetical protein
MSVPENAKLAMSVRKAEPPEHTTDGKHLHRAQGNVERQNIDLYMRSSCDTSPRQTDYV